MRLEYSNDLGSTWISATPEFNTNNQFTDYFTNIPTVDPTRAPTANPSFNEIDCTTSCSFLTGGASDTIQAGNIIAQVKLPLNYKIEFEIIVSAKGSGSEVRNILDVRDKDSGLSLHRIGLPSSSNDNTRAEYNGVFLDLYGPSINAAFTTTYTSCFIAYNSGEAVSWTSEVPGWYQRDPVTNPVSTAGKSYYLYASGPFDAANPSAGGTIRNIYITCKVYNFN